MIPVAGLQERNLMRASLQCTNKQRCFEQRGLQNLCYQNCQYEVKSGDCAGDCKAPHPIPEDALCMLLPCGRKESDGQCGNLDECRGCYVYAGVLAERGENPCLECKSLWVTDRMSCQETCGIRQTYVERVGHSQKRGAA